MPCRLTQSMANHCAGTTTSTACRSALPATAPSASGPRPLDANRLGDRIEVSDAALLTGLLVSVASAARWLLRDLRSHPANFPAPSASQGLRLRAGATGRETERV